MVSKRYGKVVIRDRTSFTNTNMPLNKLLAYTYSNIALKSNATFWYFIGGFNQLQIHGLFYKVNYQYPDIYLEVLNIHMCYEHIISGSKLK